MKIDRQEIAILVDYEKCIMCNACVVACKMEHNLPPYPTSPPVSEPEGPNFISVFQIGPEIRDGKVNQAFVAIPCMHCVNPPCMAVCPTKAISKNSNGVTQIDRDRCIGCRFCLWACPYGSPQMTPEGKIALCDLCIHRLEQGKKTACQAACVAKCIHVGTTNEMSRIRRQRATTRIETLQLSSDALE